MDFEPETPTERVALIVVELTNGEEMTTREVAELLGMHRWGAWALMNRLCRVPSLSLTFAEGKWKRLSRRTREAASID